jgi:hypothetical protein
VELIRCGAPVQRPSKNSSIPWKRLAQSTPANYAGVREAPVWKEADAHATVERCVVDCGRRKGVQPQSPQARAIFDLAIVVITVMVLIFLRGCRSSRSSTRSENRHAILHGVPSHPL